MSASFHGPALLFETALAWDPTHCDSLCRYAALLAPPASPAGDEEGQARATGAGRVGGFGGGAAGREAEELWARALEVRPNHVDALCDYGYYCHRVKVTAIR